MRVALAAGQFQQPDRPAGASRFAVGEGAGTHHAIHDDEPAGHVAFGPKRLRNRGTYQGHDIDVGHRLTSIGLHGAKTTRGTFSGEISWLNSGYTST